ncbi:MAG: hypothetical protein IPN53_01280 [Comamonadaceae bacterium]|nr:hypothetical protein [Comamonadaceae bacterium]
MCFALGAPATHAQPSPSAVSVAADDQRTLPLITQGGVAALSTDLVFWGTNWAWAGLDTRTEQLGPLQYRLLAKNKALDFDLNTEARQTAPQQMQWVFRLEARSAKAPVIGGGLVFKFDLARFAATWGEPAMLPDNRGWTWGKPGGAQVQMRFDPPLASTNFEGVKRLNCARFFSRMPLRPVPCSTPPRSVGLARWRCSPAWPSAWARQTPPPGRWLRTTGAWPPPVWLF